MIDSYVSNHAYKAISFTSMGQLNYLSTIQYVDAVIGNSSSGIVEVPSFKKGTINIGDRQKGRIQAESIINCAPVKESILDALKRIYSPQFQKSLLDVQNPYGSGNSAIKILNILKEKDMSFLKKEFFDVYQ